MTNRFTYFYTCPNKRSSRTARSTQILLFGLHLLLNNERHKQQQGLFMKLRHLLVASALCLPFTATAAEGISYTYAEASYQVWTDSKWEQHNWALKGSFQVGDQFYLAAEDQYFAHAVERSGGVGFFAPLDDNLHVYGQLSLANSGMKENGKSTGIRPILEGGARMALNNELEVRGALRYVSNAYVEEDELFIQLEGLYKLDNKIGFVGGLAIPTEADGVVLNLGARFSF